MKENNLTIQNELSFERLTSNDKITVYYNINNPKESGVYHISYALIISYIVKLDF